VDDPIIPEALIALPSQPWEGIVFRHMFGNFPPDRENTLGARWNPPQVAAVYSSLTRSGSLAEAEYQISLQPFPPRARRSLYRISVKLHSVVDLTQEGVLGQLGLNSSMINQIDHRACQSIGRAIEWLGHDGAIVPSARSANSNLVIYPNKIAPDVYEFRVLDYEVLQESTL